MTTTKTIEYIRTKRITLERISVQTLYYDLSAVASAATTLSSTSSELEGNYPCRSNDNDDDNDYDRIRELGGGEMPGVYPYTQGPYATM